MYVSHGFYLWQRFVRLCGLLVVMLVHELRHDQLVSAQTHGRAQKRRAASLARSERARTIHNVFIKIV